MQNGWVKIHRKILEKGYFKKSAYVHLWLYLLLKANHEPKEFMWNNEIIHIKEGQLLTGRKELSEATGISDSTIERILEHFEKNGHQIEQQKTTKFRVITILNWSKYQKTDNRMDSKRTTDGQQTDTNKNVKKDKNDKKVAEASSALIPEIIHSFEEINPACKRLYGNTTQRRACQDLIDTYGYEQVLKVISWLPKTNEMTWMPTITTPLQLWDKYQDLKSKFEKERNKTLSKVRGLEV